MLSNYKLEYFPAFEASPILYIMLLTHVHVKVFPTVTQETKATMSIDRKGAKPGRTGARLQALPDVDWAKVPECFNRGTIILGGHLYHSFLS